MVRHPGGDWGCRVVGRPVLGRQRSDGASGQCRFIEARACADYIEQRYNRRYIDAKDWRDDSERSVQITFYSVAQVPHLFRGNKFVSLRVEEFAFEGERFVEDRPLSPAYCVLDRSNRVIGLERDMR